MEANLKSTAIRTRVACYLPTQVCSLILNIKIKTYPFTGHARYIGLAEVWLNGLVPVCEDQPWNTQFKTPLCSKLSESCQN